MEEDIKLNNIKPVRGFATVELFDDFGKKILEEKIENTLTLYEINRIKWRLRQDFFIGHPTSLAEPIYPLNNIILTYTDSINYSAPMFLNTGAIVGWANKTPYSGADTKRGTINVVESYSTNDYVRWVFDWPTHSGNGTFQTIMWGEANNGNYMTRVVHSLSCYVPTYSTSLALDGTNLWYTICFNQTDDVFRVNPNTGQLTGRFDLPTYMTVGITWDGENLWIADYYTNDIFKLNPNTGIVVRAFRSPTEKVFGLAWDGTYLLASLYDSGMVYKLNPNTGAIISSFAIPFSRAHIVHDGTNLWLTADGSNMIYKLNPNTGEISGSFSSPISNNGLAWDGTYLWVMRSDGLIYKLDITIGTITRLPNQITKTNSNTMKVKYDFVFDE